MRNVELSEFKKTVGYIVQKSQCRPHIEALVIIPDEMSGVQMSVLCPLGVISLVRPLSWSLAINLYLGNGKWAERYLWNFVRKKLNIIQ